MDAGKMEILGINLNEFEMVKGSLEVSINIYFFIQFWQQISKKKTLSKIWLSGSRSQNHIMLSKIMKITICENHAE